MSATIQTLFILIGPLAGKTINLGSAPYPFREGKMMMVATPEETALHARFLQRNWQAYPEGHPKLKEVEDGQRDLQTDTQQDPQPPVQGDREPDGKGTEAGSETDDGGGATGGTSGDAGPVSNGDGHADQLNQKLLKAIQGLDPEKDEHWTKDGKPAMTAVEQLYGAADITRADVEGTSPGWNRDKARKAQQDTAED